MVSSSKADSMEEVYISYEGDDGELITSVHYVELEVKVFIDFWMERAEHYEDRSEYYRRLFEMHMTHGIAQN